MSDSAFKWLDSYLIDRRQSVTIRGTGSEMRILKYGVPQGCALGPELFKDYASPLASLIQSFGVSFHGYADDTQKGFEITGGPGGLRPLVNPIGLEVPRTARLAFSENVNSDAIINNQEYAVPSIFLLFSICVLK